MKNIRGLSLAEIERPTYRVETPRGATYLEIWPADDEAARLIEFAETFETALTATVSAHLTPSPHGVTNRIDTASASAYSHPTMQTADRPNHNRKG